MLTYGQQQAYRLLLSGQNVFLTGEAGTGKSYVLNVFLDEMNYEGKEVLVCAPTGIAALNIHGATLHRTFKVPIEPLSPYDRKLKVASTIKKADIIVIDEISMCRFDIFEYVAKSIKLAEQEVQLKENVIARKERREPRTFPPKQLIVVGDFFQLPPVITDKDRYVLEKYWGDRMYIGDGFAFQAPMWQEFQFQTVVLNEPVRQKNDLEFVRYLNGVRHGDVSALRWFNNNAAESKLKGIHLCPTNRDAETINKMESAKLQTPSRIYYAESRGVVNASDKPTSDELELKVGMQVMSLINDSEDKYKNGSIGRISQLRYNSVSVIFNGNEVDISPHMWEVLDYEIKVNEAGESKLEKTEIGTFSQLPLKIAYAVTIHKSQGQTYERANINPACFTVGQLYVALSRVGKIGNMHLTSDIKPRHLITSQSVLDFYNHGIRTYEPISNQPQSNLEPILNQNISLNSEKSSEEEICIMEIPESAKEAVLALLNSRKRG